MPRPGGHNEAKCGLGCLQDITQVSAPCILARCSSAAQIWLQWPRCTEVYNSHLSGGQVINLGSIHAVPTPAQSAVCKVNKLWEYGCLPRFRRMSQRAAGPRHRMACHRSGLLLIAPIRAMPSGAMGAGHPPTP